jgi:hypothetical protein
VVELRKHENAPPRRLQDLKAPARRAGVGVGGPDQDELGAGGQERIDARGRAADVAAGLQGDDGGADTIKRAFGSAKGDGRGLGMGRPRSFMGCFCEDFARRAEEDAADGGIWGCGAHPRPGEIESQARRMGEAVDRVIHLS